MVAESISKYETRVACDQASLHSCGGLGHEGLKGKFSVRGSGSLPRVVFARCE